MHAAALYLLEGCVAFEFGERQLREEFKHFLYSSEVRR
jgi:hypothetical protein